MDQSNAPEPVEEPEPNSEPPIIAHDREQLAYLLAEAAEIEHGLMCCYLYAAFSLKRGVAEGLTEDEAAAVARWRAAIAGVAVEEMLHLALVSNLLTAIGFSPQFARANLPAPAGYHPSGVVVALAPFDAATLDHFIYLERPEGVDLPDGAGFDPPPPLDRRARGDRLFPNAEDYATVGHLYRGIEDGFRGLASRLGEAALFVGDPAAQVGPDVLAMDGLIPVTDLASAVRAIETIVEQGEGSAEKSQTSHYRRFLAVRAELGALTLTRPDFVPAHPAARNPVMRKPPSPEGKVHVDDQKAGRLIDLGNALYGHAVRLLMRTFGQAEDPSDRRKVLADAAIETMFLLSPVAEMLARTPASADHPGVNAGLSFTTWRASAGAQGAATWAVLIERTEELAAGFSRAARELDPALSSIAGGLNQLAARLRKSAPALPAAATLATDASPAAPAPTATPVDAPPADAPSTPAVEEARGAALLLQFEGKRCIHSRHCVLEAPEVFRANVKGPWLNPDAIAVEALVAVAHNCPSGAIRYQRLDGGPEEAAPSVNVLRVRENGPLAVRAAIDLAGQGQMLRATLCRCGASQNKPFCDGSHHAIAFTASGEPATQDSEPLTERGGALAISPTPNGPLAVGGPVEICSGTGRTVTRTQSARLCRCGGSANKPFCDGTHARIGFQAP